MGKKCWDWGPTLYASKILDHYFLFGSEDCSYFEGDVIEIAVRDCFAYGYFHLWEREPDRGLSGASTLCRALSDPIKGQG